MVPLDHVEEMGLLHRMYGSMEAEFEVQRTIKRAELTAFLYLLRKVCGPIKIHVDNKGEIDGFRRGDRVCTKPRAGDADVWIKLGGINAFSGRKGHFGESGTCTHRTRKEKKDMSHFEKFTTEGNEKADELAKEGALLDKWFVAEARAKTM